MPKTAMDDLILDAHDYAVPGTVNELAGLPGHEDERPEQMKRGVWDSGEQRWESRSGQCFGQEYIVYDSQGEQILSCEFSREAVRPAVLTALRDFLDAVDPLPDAEAK
jgi:hypothetical protein